VSRWPLSTAALLFVLAAHLAVVLAGEPRRESRMIEAKGRVVVGPPDVALPGYDLVLAEGDRRRYPLMPTSDAQVRVLRKVAGKAGEVEVVGILSSSADRQAYIVIQYIGEYP
jgi:hypothetical protein